MNSAAMRRLQRLEGTKGIGFAMLTAADLNLAIARYETMLDNGEMDGELRAHLVSAYESLRKPVPDFLKWSHEEWLERIDDSPVSA